MGRPRKNPLVVPTEQTRVESPVTETVAKVEIVNDRDPGKYVPGIRGKVDRYKAAVNKAVNLKQGDVTCFAIAKDGDMHQSASAWQDMYGAYALKDKNGNDIKHNELIAMACPKEVHDEKIREERYHASNLLRSNIEKAKRAGLVEGSNPTNKKYFSMS